MKIFVASYKVCPLAVSYMLYIDGSIPSVLSNLGCGIVPEALIELVSWVWNEDSISFWFWLCIENKIIKNYVVS